MDDFFDFDRAAGGASPSPPSQLLYRSHADDQTLDDCYPDLYPPRNPATPRLVREDTNDAVIGGTSNIRTEAKSTSADDPSSHVRGFSREVVRILRHWLSSHGHYPYPTNQEKEVLKEQTGLTKGQITTWFANARRKKKFKAPRAYNAASPRGIPRPPTPIPTTMSPLERWQNSPPEDEPAAVSAIFDAVNSSAASSGHGDDYNLCSLSSSSSRCLESSTTDTDTPLHSGESCSSVYSSVSGDSSGSFLSFRIYKHRRRSKKPPRPPMTLASHMRPHKFHCTFCTDTFKTKYDWQRHEKSLHLSLECWTCTPHGPTVFSPERNLALCIYCGAHEPDPSHTEAHGYKSCAERPVESRTFYRKDHLRQHLNLVHSARFQSWSMSAWKTETQSVRARCGFCGLWMGSWAARVDHLADHFKNGMTMADWKGNWGLEPGILALLENEMPPCEYHPSHSTWRLSSCD